MSTHIEVFGMIINEPVNVLTDLLVTFVSFSGASRLSGSSNHKKTLLYFKYSFIFLGIATLYGGVVGHGLMHYLDFKWKLPGWIISMLSVMLMERAVISHAMPLLHPAVAKLYLVTNIAEIIFLLTIVLVTVNFLFVEAHAAYGLMVVVFSLELFIFIKSKAVASRFILAAIFVSMISAAVHLSGFSLHIWFNHVDLSHVLMACSAWLICKGASHVNDVPGESR